MVTAFSSGDRRRIVTALGLDRAQLLNGSRLSALMQTVETYEGQGATGLVDDIRAILTAIEEAKEVRTGDSGEALGPVLESSGQADEGLEVIDIPGEVRLEYKDKASASDIPSRTMAANKQRLRDLLDPDKVLLGCTPGGLILW